MLNIVVDTYPVSAYTKRKHAICANCSDSVSIGVGIPA